jgi:hypothetical protein
MSRVLFLRASAILLMLTGAAFAYTGWILAGGLFARSFAGEFSYITYRNAAIAYGVLALLGLGTLISQALSQRHWLGWIGIALSMIGLVLITITTALVYTSSSFALPGRFFYVLELLGSPLFSLGMVFWAADLPNTSHVLLVQKAAMGLVALVPSFQYVFALEQLYLGWSRQLVYLLPTGLSALCWIALGVSVLIYSFSAEAANPNKPKASFADSSVGMVVSPIPPEDL